MHLINPRGRLSGILGLIGDVLLVLSALASAVLTFYYLREMLHLYFAKFVFTGLAKYLYPWFS